MTYTAEQLREILDKHAKWLRGAAGGSYAYLTYADLTYANLSRANLSYADLSRANLSGADLSRADLSRANLSGANLSGANLSAADLTYAYLTYANLSGANLSGANLSGANLSAADLTGADFGSATPEEVARLDAVREIVLAKPERLRMATWHSDEWTPDHTPEEEQSCGSAHCIAGWLQALSPDPAIRQMDPVDAGVQLAPTAAGLFYSDDDFVLRWFRDRAYAPKAETEVQA